MSASDTQTIPAGDQQGPPKGLGASIAAFFKNYAQFKGYSARPEFWWPYLLLVLLHAAVGAATSIILGTAFADDISTEPSDPAMQNAEMSYALWFEGPAAIVLGLSGLVHLAIFAATIIPLLAVIWRRFHDMGLPGPMFFLWFIPVVGWIIVLIMLARPSRPDRRRQEWDAPGRSSSGSTGNLSEL